MSSGSVRFKGTLTVTTAKTQLGSDLISPSTARELLSITPYCIQTTYTADIPSIVRYELESSDADLNPTKISVLLNGPEDAAVTIGASTMIYKTYSLNTPIGGGDVIKLYGTNVIDMTTDPYCGAGVLISDQRTGKPQTYWTSPDAANNYGTGNDSYVAGATYRWNNSARITKVYGFGVTNTTRTVSDSIGGTIKLESPDFVTNLPQQYPIQPTLDNSTTLGSNQTPTVSLWNVNIPTDPIVAVTEYFDQEALTSAGGIAWMTGVGYNKTKTRR